MEPTSARWRAVQLSMWAGLLYDAAFAGAILFAARPAARLLRLEVPADPVYFRLNGILLLLIAGTYLLPALAPRRYQGVVAVATFGRFLGFVYFLIVWLDSSHATFLGLGLGDLFFSLLHALLLLRARRAGA